MEILSRCGFRCDLCLAFRPNIEYNPSNRQIISDGWQKFFGFRIPPEEILCDGCWSDNGIRLDKDCPVRPCVIEHAIVNCAVCQDYGCEKLQSRLVSIEEIAAKTAEPIVEEERIAILYPFENKERLEEIRRKNI